MLMEQHNVLTKCKVIKQKAVFVQARNECDKRQDVLSTSIYVTLRSPTHIEISLG